MKKKHKQQSVTTVTAAQPEHAAIISQIRALVVTTRRECVKDSASLLADARKVLVTLGKAPEDKTKDANRGYEVTFDEAKREVVVAISRGYIMPNGQRVSEELIKALNAAAISMSAYPFVFKFADKDKQVQ